MKEPRFRWSSAIFGVIAVVLLIVALLLPPQRRDIRQSTTHVAGKAASDYLLHTKDGRSLMQALTVARFGLQWQQDGPGDSGTGGGYLGMSHDQNLNAWFSENGVTVRPTLPEAKRDQIWKIELGLKAYGYGKELADVPPVISREVKGNRVEYFRQDQRTASDSSNRQSPIENRKLIEWYENQSAGIEQGFTLSARPERGVEVGEDEPLRLVVAVTGDLRARAKDEGQAIELSRQSGETVLSYSKLTALDADGRKLAARMETSADGGEIALVVDDKNVAYPIVIDPIVASLEQKLDADNYRQLDARFGFSVAIDNNRAVVGAWREDFGPNNPDGGAVYSFTRSGNTWSRLFLPVNGRGVANDSCGWSVAISGDRIIYGCPGANSQTGSAYRLFDEGSYEMIPPTGSRAAGDRFGHSVAISGNNIAVGAPLNGTSDTGLIQLFTDNGDGSVTRGATIPGDVLSGSPRQLGTSVAIDGNLIIAGAPGAGAGRAFIFELLSGGNVFPTVLQASDGETGDTFGDSVAISGNTAVIGADNDDDKGTDAGAVYVFVRGANGVWSQQQKLTASDGRTGDHFSTNAVAIEGNTIVVGADEWDGGTPPFIFKDDNRGEAYIFTRNGTVWTEQTSIRGEAAGDQFGISVDISGNSIIIGARAADAPGVPRAGTAYVYRLDCVPPASTSTYFDPPFLGRPTSKAVCPGSGVELHVEVRAGGPPTGFQWRKNGVNIPGATSDSYTISSATPSDAGSYDVIVSNSCGSDISAPATLTVYSFSLNPTSQNFGVSGSNGVVNVTASGGTCPWTANSNSSFITVTSGSNGTGSGTVGFTVAANPNPGQRTGSITIAGLAFSVSQDGTNCSYSIAPTSLSAGPAASTNSVNVTAGAGCAWTATSNDPSFLSINTGASGTGNGTVTYTIAANSATTQRIGTLTIAGQTFTVTQAAGGPTVLGNISTRLRVETGDNALIGGFIITGTQPKKVIVRAIGPSLSQFFSDTLSDPTLELRNGAGTLLDSNDNWGSSPNKQAIIDTGVAPSNEAESAIIATLPANGAGYTAIVRGANNSTGIGVVEAYDLDRTVDSKLANISTRGLIQTGDNALFAGMIVVGTSSQKVMVRAIGPSLNIPGKLADPTLELRNANGDVIRADDNWRTGGQEAEIMQSGVAPPNDQESALIETVPGNGAYTAIVRGKDDTTGIAVVEVYALN